MKRYLIDGAKDPEGWSRGIDISEHEYGNWVRYEDIKDLQAENARLKEVNKQFEGALRVIANGVCEDTECEEVISILVEQGLLNKTEGREE